MQIGFGYNPKFAFQGGFSKLKGGKLDFLGFDDGTRAIPATENIPQFAEAVGNPDGPDGLRYKEILGNFGPTMAAMQHQ